MICPVHPIKYWALAQEEENMDLRPVRRQIVSPLPAILLLLAAVAAPIGLAGDSAQKYPPTILFMTDFGVFDDSVAICKGVMHSISPDARIEDITHQVTPFSIPEGGRCDLMGDVLDTRIW